MPRLRELSEAECYTRLYGRDGEPTVTVLGASPALERPSVTGDDLRRLFEERLAERDPSFRGEEAA